MLGRNPWDVSTAGGWVTVVRATDLEVLGVGCRWVIDQMYLNAVEETGGYDWLKRVFGRAGGIAATDFTNQSILHIFQQVMKPSRDYGIVNL